jgi:hypothetical protein
MLKHLLLTALAAAFAVSVGYADQSNTKVTIPVTKTSPTSGRQMFSSYCAPCHGVDGRGHGPAATALKTPPADLTGLVKETMEDSRTPISLRCCSLAWPFQRTDRRRCQYGVPSLER